MSYNAEQVPDLLGPGGVLAAALAPYEDRPFQRELALEIARLFEDGGKLAVEAPTGIGKSLAYALPAALWAAEGHGPVVVSTHTKALQNQLLDLEAPRLRLAVGPDLRVFLLKGRANYLCRRRYEAAVRDATTEGTQRLLERIRPWVERTETGDFGTCGERNARDLRFLALHAASEPRFCRGSACSPQSGCFFKQARARAGTADLLVVNHALLATHLFGEGDVLPEFPALIVDEAHAFVRVAIEHLTVAAGPMRLQSLVDASPGGGGSLPEVARSGEGASRLVAVHRSLSTAERIAREWFGKKNGARGNGDDRRRYSDPEELAALCPLDAEPVFHALGTLSADAGALALYLDGNGVESESEGAFLAEIGRFQGEVEALRKDMDVLLHPDPQDRERVHWKEWSEDGFSLNASPLEAGPRVAAALASGPERLVFTSATLAAGKDFNYFSREVGFEGVLPSIAYPSPFDFTTQALALAVRRGPDPREPGWAEATAQTLDALMHDPARKTMALFTSYRDLDAVRALVGGSAYDVFAQGEHGTASDVLAAFRRAERALLLGTSSFWEGVDLPGDDLEVLVLTRLPFGVPTEPRYQARAERLEAEGGNPFTDLYLPEAVLRFKQGFGRLIRRRADRGIVAVLDTRLLSKNYGGRFRDALPLPVTAVEDGSALARAAATWWNSGAVLSRQGDPT
jgi:ATP-dependent DNA helicase DinG